MQLQKEREARQAAEERIRKVVADHKRLEIELVRYRDHFESLVANRTAELMATNEKLMVENRERRMAERERRAFEDQFREASLMLEATLSVSRTATIASFVLTRPATNFSTRSKMR
jgi:C4-dicarboxylate-specific signal transduction histidine kinase